MITPVRVVREVVELRFDLPLNARDLSDIYLLARREFDPGNRGNDDAFWVKSDGEQLIITNNYSD